MTEPQNSEPLSLNYNRTDSIALPQSAAERRFAIRMSDWERLKRSMKKCSADFKLDFSGWYFCCFGISGSAFLSIIPLGLSQNVPAWAVPLYVCVGTSGLVVGLAFLLIGKQLAKDRTSRIGEIQLDMDDIEQGFEAT